MPPKCSCLTGSVCQGSRQFLLRLLAVQLAMPETSNEKTCRTRHSHSTNWTNLMDWMTWKDMTLSEWSQQICCRILWQHAQIFAINWENYLSVKTPKIQFSGSQHFGWSASSLPTTLNKYIKLALTGQPDLSGPNSMLILWKFRM